MKKNLIVLFVILLTQVGLLTYAQETNYDIKATAIVSVLQDRISYLSEPEEKQERQKLYTKLGIIKNLFPSRPDFTALVDAILSQIGNKIGITTTNTQTTVNVTTTTTTTTTTNTTTTSSTSDPALDAIRQQVLDILNQERKNAGLNTLTLNPLLNDAAQKQAYYMRETDDFAHVSKNGSTFQDRADAVGYKYLALGENIAAGQDTASEVMAARMGSEGHKKNILDPKYTEIGIGFYNQYWVQMF